MEKGSPVSVSVCWWGPVGFDGGVVGVGHEGVVAPVGPAVAGLGPGLGLLGGCDAETEFYLLFTLGAMRYRGLGLRRIIDRGPSLLRMPPIAARTLYRGTVIE